MHLFQFLCVCLILVSALLSAAVVVMRDAQRGQAQMVQQAEEFYKDKLYMRAINTYQEAVRRYSTPNNPAIERGILQIYKEAGKMEAYYDLIKTGLMSRKRRRRNIWSCHSSMSMRAVFPERSRRYSLG